MSIGDIASGAAPANPVLPDGTRVCPRRRQCRARRFSTRSTSCVMPSSPIMTMVTPTMMMTPMTVITRG
eukprot:7274939-Prymnesium_polylepis.1